MVNIRVLFAKFTKTKYRGFSLKWSNHLSGVTEVQISKVYHFEWMYHLSGCIIWVELLFFFRSVSFWASRQLDAKWLANLEQEYMLIPRLATDVLVIFSNYSFVSNFILKVIKSVSFEWMYHLSGVTVSWKTAKKVYHLSGCIIWVDVSF